MKNQPIRRPDNITKTKSLPQDKQQQSTKPQSKSEGKTSIQDEFKLNPALLKNMNKRKKKTLRKAGESAWVDETLDDWVDGDFRIFCGNMGNEVTDDVLANAFKKYASFSKARVVRDKKTMKSRGYGFVSLLKVDDYIKAMREMQGKYVGNRPITLKKG